MRPLLILMLLGSPWSPCAQAQNDEAEEQARSVIRLATGFTPDPTLARGRTVGTTALRTQPASCGGFVGSEPDHVIDLRTAFGFLRMFLVSAQDLTLALRGPDDRWQCSTALGDTPALLDGRFLAGRYEVWVGGPALGSHVEYELSLTEFHSVGPSEEVTARQSGGIDVGLAVGSEAGRFRDRRIRRGFLPDPIVDRATSGGDIDVRLLGADCEGFVQSTPNHVVTLRDDFDYLRVQLGGASGETSLVLRTPGGRYLCSAPEAGNAFVDQDAWSAGVYRIWVGGRVADATPDYAICYTESRVDEASATCRQDGDARGHTHL